MVLVVLGVDLLLLGDFVVDLSSSLLGRYRELVALPGRGDACGFVEGRLLCRKRLSQRDRSKDGTKDEKIR